MSRRVTTLVALCLLGVCFVSARVARATDLSGMWREDVGGVYTVFKTNAGDIDAGIAETYSYTLCHTLTTPHRYVSSEGTLVVFPNRSIMCTKTSTGQTWRGRLDSHHHMTWFNAPPSELTLSLSRR
ncbi:MAG: hypothetical protein ABIK89_04350 [Planctomycetota bacterium]